MNRNRPLVALACLTLVGLLGSSCDSAGPVAPNGTTLIVTAAPTRIGVSGTSEITVIGRKPDGNPLLRDTEIRLSTTLGTVPALVLTDGNGVARAILRADGRTGKATVSATTVGSGGTSGGGTTGGGTTGGTTGGSGTVEIQVGESAETKPTLLVSANPNNVPVTGTSTITIIARNPDGTSVSAGQTVILTSTLGSLNPSRPTTRSDGTAVSTLSVGTQAGTATVTALLGSSDAVTTTVAIRDAPTNIGLSAPSSSVAVGASLSLTAIVNNAQGQAVQGSTVTFSVANAIPSNIRASLSPTIDLTGPQGDAQTQLTIDGTSPIGTLEVVATAASGSGETLTARFLVTVR
ncbi:MAG: hypothetical protein SF066_07705 [Thermoanaerobaculia bacterium]|nr:hypothetical protein [Thermoanaerobaculia bacterium]